MESHAILHPVKDETEIVCCPPENVAVWNMHPRVYLALDENGSVSCPYCGDIYRLDDK